jgi:1,4-alpha-glucan branching enzyme
VRKTLLFEGQGACQWQPLSGATYDQPAKLIVFHRWEKQGRKHCYKEDQTEPSNIILRQCCCVTADELWKTRFNSDSYNYDPNLANHTTTEVETSEDGSDGLPCSGEIGIGPYTVVISSQDE